MPCITGTYPLIYDANAIQVLDYSDFNENFNTSLIGMEVAYDTAVGLPNHSSNRLELSLIYRIKIF